MKFERGGSILAARYLIGAHVVDWSRALNWAGTAGSIAYGRCGRWPMTDLALRRG
jgi:hypothetical protein